MKQISTMVNQLYHPKVPGSLQRPLLFVLQAVAAVFVAGCAGQIPPSGGPPDAIPPVVIRTVPDSNAVRVTEPRVEFEFSEYVDRRSVEEALFISPYPGTLEFDWSGREVSVRFSDTLRSKTTYVVSLGTDVVDIRAQNRMARGFTLAFSTGDSLDHGAISGHVVDERPDGVMLFAYNLAGIDPDTLDPSHTRPDYVMQTGNDGKFLLSNIALSRYRLVAVRDEYKNLLYDREIDQYGVARGDIALTPEQPEVRDVWFRLGKEDTTRPFLSSATAPDRYHILLRFSEPMDTLTFERTVVSITDTLGGSMVRPGALWLDMANTALARIETLDPMDSTKAYRVAVTVAKDRAGNVVDTVHARADFVGPTAADTSRPVVQLRGIADSSRGIATTRGFEMAFSKPVDLAAAMKGIRLTDSSWNAVDVQLLPRNATELWVNPAKPLAPLCWYTFHVVLDSVRDSRGNLYRDSVFRRSFQTVDLRTTGTIEGRVMDQQGEGKIVVSVQSVDLVPPRSASAVIGGPGPFALAELVEGKYAVQAYRDADGNGIYSPGQPFPFVPSERFTVYPDTLKVRARWGMEGVVLSINPR